MRHGFAGHVRFDVVRVACFCGCGASVPRFPIGLRRVNRLAADVASRLAAAEEVYGRWSADRRVRGWYRDGDAILEALTTQVHGSGRPPAGGSGSIAAWLRAGLDLEAAANRRWTAFRAEALHHGMSERAARAVFADALLDGREPAIPAGEDIHVVDARGPAAPGDRRTLAGQRRR